MIEIECPLCGQETVKEKLYDLECKGNKIGIVRCEQCKLIFVSPNLTREEMKAFVSKDFFIAPSHQKLIEEGNYNFQIYLDNVQNKDIFGYPNYLEPEHLKAKLAWGKRIMDWLKLGYRRLYSKEFKPSSLLEVGGATGHMSLPFVVDGWSPVVVTELSDWCHEYNSSGKGCHLDMRICNPEELDIEDKAFDCVMLWDTLEHLQYPVLSLNAINRMTKDKMIGVIQCPNAEDYILEPENHLVSPGQHCFHYDHNTLEKILNKCGFKFCSEKVSPEAGEMVILFTKKL